MLRRVRDFAAMWHTKHGKNRRALRPVAERRKWGMRSAPARLGGRKRRGRHRSFGGASGRGSSFALPSGSTRIRGDRLERDRASATLAVPRSIPVAGIRARQREIPCFRSHGTSPGRLRDGAASEKLARSESPVSGDFLLSSLRPGILIQRRVRARLPTPPSNPLESWFARSACRESPREACVPSGCNGPLTDPRPCCRSGQPPLSISITPWRPHRDREPDPLPTAGCRNSSFVAGS
jgi:hypothetical protein